MAQRQLKSLAEIRQMPLEDRPLFLAITLERILKQLPCRKDEFTAGHNSRQLTPDARLTLFTLVKMHREKFARLRQLLGVVWVRDDAAHGDTSSDEDHWRVAVKELERALQELKPWCDPV